MAARFEIVQTDAEQPWHARFIAANGETVWTTENYTNRATAILAINFMASAFGGFVWEPAAGTAVARPIGPDIEVRDVDERVS